MNNSVSGSKKLETTMPRTTPSFPSEFDEQTCDAKQKSPKMIAFFFLVWILSIVWFGPRLWKLVATSTGVAEYILLFTFGLFLVLFWMLAAYYLAVVVFSVFGRPSTAIALPPAVKYPRIALLYPTCNDFQYIAAESCLNQDYPDFHIYLLDDSTDARHQALVDAFHCAHPKRTTVIRRPDRQGFKAGNLNYALQNVAVDQILFAVVDADERLPIDFLTKATAHMCDTRVAFVQANHAPNPRQESAFARDIASTILPFWHVHCQPRNRYGFVLYLGHGAVVRRAAWETVGGFPEVVLEDLAFSAALGIAGLRGVFLADLECYEDFPDTYVAFKRQHERYVIGVTQVIHRFLKPLLASPRASWTEKIDFCLWCTPLYVPALCLLFVAFNLALIGFLGSWKTLTIAFMGHSFNLQVVQVAGERFAPLWSWDFRLMSVIGAVAPAFGCFALGIKGKLRPARLLLLSTTPYLSVMLVSWRGILGYLLQGRIFSPPTGEAVTSLVTLSMNREACWHSLRRIEVGVGLSFAVASLLTANIGQFGICCCILVGAWMESPIRSSRSVHIASAVCFVAILLQLLINTTLVGSFPGLVTSLFSVHF
jgi:cellulose synthase/poly-beta-1,6-N-acetylglucosamine synthase-like glycosyltransferase